MFGDNAAMSARYYSVRRLNPYRGVVQVAEVGDAEARSHDGVTWHLRADDGFGWVRPVGVWVEGEGLKAGAAFRCPGLLEALQSRPSLPFPLADHIELWLLDKQTGLPLALLDAQRPSTHHAAPAELEWIPFALPYRGFHSPALAAQEPARRQPIPHRDFLTRLVSQRARPYAAAQWFQRRRDGSGCGLAGYRLQPGWQGRELPAADFPALLVDDCREIANNQLEWSVISDYHAWLSPFLLCWQTLPDALRGELEIMASQRPRWLAQIYRLLPVVLDPERLRAALVAARLEDALESSEGDLFQ